MAYSMGRPSQAQPALAKAIRQLREKIGLSQEDLAHEAGITTSTLSTIERGQSNPTWGTVKGIAKGLSVPLSELAKLEAKLDR
jgi:XRE family transcriptional regulator, regulator of sulfur utilization